MPNTVIGRRMDALHLAVTNALYKARENGAINFEALPHFVIETPREASHGDFATNAATDIVSIIFSPLSRESLNTPSL
jgi:arginyl-tRNA synthetase